MKKYAKKVLCLVLTVLLFGSMAVPAAAETATGTGKYGNNYGYSWSVYCADNYGTAQISANGSPVYVKAYAECTVYNADLRVTGISSSVQNVNEVPSYYVSAFARADNTFTYYGETWTGEVQKTMGKFWVDDELVVLGVFAFPG